MNLDNLKLIYIYKIGTTSKGDGLYEFILSEDPTNIDSESWGWELSPACDNAQPPSEDYYDKIISLKTDKFSLTCLHEAVDREYMHGYHNIHALAYENDEISTDGFESYEDLDNYDKPLLVFHYGMSLNDIKGVLSDRDIILNGDKLVEPKDVKILE